MSSSPLTRVLTALVFLLLLVIVAVVGYALGYLAAMRPHVPLEYQAIVASMTSPQGWTVTDRVVVFAPPNSEIRWDTPNGQDFTFQFSETEKPRIEVRIPLFGNKSATLSRVLLGPERAVFEIDGAPDLVLPVR